jgi:hypothetical protein
MRSVRLDYKDNPCRMDAAQTTDGGRRALRIARVGWQQSASCYTLPEQAHLRRASDWNDTQESCPAECTYEDESHP